MGSPRRSSVLVDLAAGSCGGVASTIVCHPLDTIRTRLQADLYQHVSGRAASLRFQGALHCTRHTVRTEGVGALYRGIAWLVCSSTGVKCAACVTSVLLS